MKKLLFLLLTAFIMLPMYASVSSDTIIVLDNKQIHVNEEDDRIKIRVYELTDEGESIEKDMIFEGHYRDDVVHERRNFSRTINLSVPTTTAPWNRRFDPHWAGFGIGFNSFSDNKF